MKVFIKSRRKNYRNYYRNYRKNQGKSHRVFFAGVLAFALLYVVWEAAAGLMGASIILPGPGETFRETLRLISGAGFWYSLGSTLLRGLAGFAVSFVLGLAAGFLAGKYPLFAGFIHPYMTIIRSTPLMALILIAIVWFPTEAVPVFAAVLMAFPVVCQNVASGVRAVDPGLVEMARVYRAGKRRLFARLYFPSLAPFLAAGISSGLGLAWRVVVAAEVLSQPLWGIGTGMQEAKMRLETPRVFAWTAAALLLSWLSDFGLSRFSSWKTDGRSL
ncbi:MAG: ABC transporter permease subunit [Spirochaetales bacterium]|jgi:NitT/TauT family transport system permease protein|nr:ABC transporter permease subunit [Spirochaetales bacterium]